MVAKFAAEVPAAPVDGTAGVQGITPAEIAAGDGVRPPATPSPAVFDPTPSDYRRDRWGRPLIVPKGGGKPIPYTRASSAAKTIEDTFNLELWARRNVAYGMARDASLVARVLAVGGDPGSWTQDQKKVVNKIHEDAQKVAQAHKGADIGTAVHTLTERRDRGEDVDGGPYQADLEAYVGALNNARLLVIENYVECRMVCDELEMAGTADRILVHGGDRYYIADLKTGPTVDFGGLGWAAQLAAYANGVLYDVATDERMPTPELDREVGYIIHLPAGQGRCDIYEIDLAAGYRAAQLANEIRATRKASKGWITKRVPSAPPFIIDTEKYPAGLVITTPSRGDLVARLGQHPDEGAMVDPERFADLEKVYRALDQPTRDWFQDIVKESAQAGVDVRAHNLKSRRRHDVYDGLLTLAVNRHTDPDIVRALVARALDSDAPLFPTITVGHAVGALDFDAARRFADDCLTFANGDLAGVVDADDGLLRLVTV
jgi:hypothetical protein